MINPQNEGCSERQLQIPHAMEDLGIVIKSLEDKCSILIERLKPIMAPEQLKPDPVSDKQIGSNVVPLVEGLSNQIGRIQSIIDIINKVLNRLEI